LNILLVPNAPKKDHGSEDLICVVADHVCLVIPLTKGAILVEVDEYDLEYGTVDEAFEDT
jgi:hypothetical protein